MITPPPPELPANSFLQQLIGDVIEANQRLASNDTQGNRRDVVRTTFAAIEGSVWTMRESVRAACAMTGDLSPGADFALRELTIHVDDKGRISEQVRHMTLRTLIRLTVNQAQLLDNSFKPRFDDYGWSGFGEAIAIRHRITHPKTTPDLTIADSDLAKVRSGLMWLMALVQETMLRTTVASRLHLDRTKDLLDALRRGDPETLILYHETLMKED